ncbi:aminopeptidase P family protein [Alphaproteobacteria bacterium KMM 3653]|uniref:Aminopeptidase P family protein n=1 Tax=Harenicola maris TaxID=2841044 RepID=A0AAP2G3R1_9RHOB|nr:aminopeptidase P family protein [Harenicola maris]
MTQPYAQTRKIDPTKGSHLPDGTPNNADRIEIGPTRLALREWEAAGLTLPNLPAMREYRWKRLTQHIVDRGYGGLLMFDPLNIRYATDSTNMQLWNTHNPFRAVLLLADGYMVIWDYKNAPFLSAFNPLVREVRDGASMFYFANGDRTGPAAESFAADVADLMQQRAPGHKALAVDKIMIHGLRALEAQGLKVMEGEELTEKARAIKGPDEILAMRCANHACETSVKLMEDFARKNTPLGETSEDDIWAVLHAENIRRGGEWIETRLLASGPRTNPWFQECGPRITRPNEIIAFDTDLIGAYGICIDISRTWWIGDQPPRPDMIEAMKHAVEHIETNKQMLRPGVMIPELTANTHRLHDKYQKQKYSCLMHGVGLCDEWPLVAYPDKATPGAFDHPLEAGMTLCVEALVGEEGGDFSIKLEDQVLITEEGHETLTTYPWDAALMGYSSNNSTNATGSLK